MKHHDGDRRWMERALQLAHLCPPSQTAFSVGAVIVDADGNEISNGYSRETDDHVHAEESALAKLPTDDPRLSSATIYSTLEPCTKRKSRPLPCTQLILKAGLARVVIAWREPDLLVTNCTGVEDLRSGDVAVDELPALADAAMVMNRHLLP
ncbi:deaminase [Streptomyces kanamyceticus]|uniref:dCMP deaminase n=1 Tax=Streptomyces kanamyceticus TaxID=1967 RepID=A0A5J6GG01_STRKN|nr:deaminase [Streptomyces kanamyceticus]QEU92871.1 dCMP deaminase [Streptomyces kanamyceticus]